MFDSWVTVVYQSKNGINRWFSVFYHPIVIIFGFRLLVGWNKAFDYRKKAALPFESPLKCSFCPNNHLNDIHFKSSPLTNVNGGIKYEYMITSLSIDRFCKKINKKYVKYNVLNKQSKYLTVRYQSNRTKTMIGSSKQSQITFLLLDRSIKTFGVIFLITSRGPDVASPPRISGCLIWLHSPVNVPVNVKKADLTPNHRGSLTPPI